MDLDPFDEVETDPDAVLAEEGVETVEDLCLIELSDTESVDLVSEVSEDVLEKLFGDLSEFSIEYAGEGDS